MITLDDVTISYGSHPALTNASGEFEGGTTVALVGPNGSGKTTLLDLLAGLTSPSSGRIERDAAHNVGYVAQQQHQHQWMPLTVGEVLRMGRYRRLGLFRPLRASDRQAASHAAERLGIADLTSRPFTALSGGQRQRVLVAAALVGEPDVLLLDEPITGLDLPSQQLILDVVDDERDQGRLVVLSTHHLDEARHCDRVLLLHTRVVADGPPDRVLTEANLSSAFGAANLTKRGSTTIVLDDHGHGSHEEASVHSRS